MMNEKKRLSGKTWVKRLLSFVLALAMMVTLLPTSGLSVAKAAETGTVLYLKPNDNWKVDGARFAAYFFGNGEKWVDMIDADGDGYYQGIAPTGYPNVIFCRMKSDTTVNDWPNKWNQTGDLTVPTNGNNLYTINAGQWDSGLNGTWSKYMPTYIVAGMAGLCVSDWAPSDTANKMETSGNGIFVKTYENVLAGTYEYKVTNGSWDKSWGTDNNNASVTVDKSGSTVSILFDESSATVSAEVEAPYDIVFVGTNVSLEGDRIVKKGADYTAKLTVEKGYLLPETVQVTSGGSSVEHTYSNGQLTVPNVTGDLTITAKGIAVYDVTLTGTNVTITGENTVKEGADYTATLKADEGYLLPEEINVTTNSEAVDHQYNKENGTLTIPAANIKGDLVIAAEGQEKPDTKTIYLIPGVWETDGAWFAAWVWKTGEEGVEHRMSDEDANGSYQVEIPYDADNVIFIRNNPEYSNGIMFGIKRVI